MSVPPEVTEVLRRRVRKAEHDVEVRYADDWLEPQREDALRSFELAERVGTEARRLLPPDVLI